MEFTVYILHSETVNKFYTGYTGDQIQERLRRHHSNHKGFTGKANDWQIVYQQTFSDKKLAMAFEKKIKKRGAKRFLDSRNI